MTDAWIAREPAAHDGDVSANVGLRSEPRRSADDDDFAVDFAVDVRAAANRRRRPHARIRRCPQSRCRRCERCLRGGERGVCAALAAPWRPGSIVGAVGSTGFGGGVLPARERPARRSVEIRHLQHEIGIVAETVAAVHGPVTGAPSIAIVESDSSTDLIDVLKRGVSTTPFAIGTISNRGSSCVRRSST